jgi:hypothetical protein
MSYKTDFSAADLTWQVMLIKEFPKIANKHFYPAMHRATNTIKTGLSASLPFQSRTGAARAELRKAVSGSGLNITGRVGWKYGARAWYVNVLEYGAVEHPIGYVPALNLKIKMHPGLPALKFMERAQEDAKSKIDPEMERALVSVANDLSRKGL